MALSPSLIAALRGVRGRCPACGRGRLFAGYLKQAPACTDCGAATGSEKKAEAPTEWPPPPLSGSAAALFPPAAAIVPASPAPPVSAPALPGTTMSRESKSNPVAAQWLSDV